MTKDQHRETVALLQGIKDSLDEMARSLEKIRLADYIEMLERPGRLLYMNFLMGIVRGFGMAIGFTILAALVLWILQRLVVLNLPLIGNFIADVVKWVQMELQMGGTTFPGGG